MVASKIEFTLLLVCLKIDLINLKLLYKKVCIGSDHAGFKLKNFFKKRVNKKIYQQLIWEL